MHKIQSLGLSSMTECPTEGTDYQFSTRTSFTLAAQAEFKETR